MHSKDDSWIKQRLNRVIDSASSWYDVEPLINKIPLNELKEYLQEMINNSHQNKVDIRSMYWGFVGNIENILPSDLMQYILTFLRFDLQFVKVVNKRWKRLSELNEKICYSQLSKQNANIAYDEEINTTYIIRYPQIELTTIEKRMNFKMIPYFKRKQVGEHDIVLKIDIISNMLKDGDRIFVFGGRYIIEKPVIINTNISIIGIAGSGKHRYFLETPNVVYSPPLFREKQFDMKKPTITVNGCTLNINGCKLSTERCSPIIQINKDASLFINKNSTIYGYLDGISNMNNAAIMIRDDATKVQIINSKFHGFQHCIGIINQGKTMIKKFICKNNLFINIQSYPIIKTHGHHIESEENYDKSIYQIHNNKLDFIKSQNQHNYMKKYVNKIKFVSHTPFSLTQFGLFY